MNRPQYIPIVKSGCENLDVFAGAGIEG